MLKKDWSTLLLTFRELQRAGGGENSRIIFWIPKANSCSLLLLPAQVSDNFNSMEWVPSLLGQERAEGREIQLTKDLTPKLPP